MTCLIQLMNSLFGWLNVLALCLVFGVPVGGLMCGVPEFSLQSALSARRPMFGVSRPVLTSDISVLGLIFSVYCRRSDHDLSTKQRDFTVPALDMLADHPNDYPSLVPVDAH